MPALELELLVFVAEADAAASGSAATCDGYSLCCCSLCCCSLCCCLLSWDSDGGTAVNSAAAVAWLPSRYSYSYAVFFFSPRCCFPLLACFFAAHPRPAPLYFGGVACRTFFTSNANTPMMERNFTFFSGGKVFFRRTVFANTLLLRYSHHWAHKCAGLFFSRGCY